MMKESDLNRIIKKQFNKQAENFSNWSITKSVKNIKGYFDFCKINHEDILLDVACGTGEFAIFAAKRIKEASGVDISEGMIEIAKKRAAEAKLSNIKFICQNVQELAFEDNSFTAVVCKSSFHHMPSYKKVFSEMIRCCKKKGKISVRDIIAYKNKHVNDFFERLEKAIDISHYDTLSNDSIISLFGDNGLSISNTFEMEAELNFKDYVSHAKQTKENQSKIEELLKIGLEDNKISKYFLIKGNEVFFKRNVFMVLREGVHHANSWELPH